MLDPRVTDRLRLVVLVGVGPHTRGKWPTRDAPRRLHRAACLAGHFLPVCEEETQIEPCQAVRCSAHAPGEGGYL